jgi:MFS family permease
MKRRTGNPLLFVYLATFLFATHQALTAYVNSTYLSTAISNQIVGILYSVGSFITLFGLSFIPKVTSRFGNYRTTLGLYIFSGICLFLVGVGIAPLVTIIAFVFYLCANNLIVFSTDIFVEHYAKRSTLGHSRGLYLTLVNLAWVGTPLLAGYIATNLGYSALYGISFTYLLFGGFVIGRTCKDYKDSHYIRMPVFRSLTLVHKNKDIERAVAANFILQFFYAWMVIYAPLYLHNVVGFGWDQIGIIFTIMLLPFVLLEYPLGALADKYFGEKEILLLGFAIAGTTTIIFGTLNFDAPLLAWGFILFMTRVGASMIESMTEIYFFKKISDKNTNLISVFRDTGPIAYTVAPLIASLLLIKLPYQSLFVVLGFVVWLGILVSLRLHDTK